MTGFNRKLTSPSTIKHFMEKHGFRFSKSLGQNFLISEDVVDNIMDGAEIGIDDCILEVGPGIGVMTRALAERAGKVVAVEIDRSLTPVLYDTVGDLENVRVEFADILKTDIQKIIDEDFGGKKPKVVANLPYYVTTPIVMMFLENDIRVQDIVVMVQKEVADRMMAKPGKKDYGVLSVAVQFYSEPSIITKVPRGCFMPAPNVDSAVIRLKVKPEMDLPIDDKDTFFATVRASFGKRRKTIINSMMGDLPLSKEALLACLAEAGVDPIRRGETLSIDEFALLSNIIFKAMKA